MLMPVYNGGKYLRPAIESILNQTYRDFEFIILYDHSTDNSLNIITSYNDSRIHLYKNNQKIGLPHILNIGLTLSQGDYVARMDCDDISLPTRLEKQVHYLDNNPTVGVCGTWIKFIGDKHWTVRYPIDSETIKCSLLFRCVLAHPSIMLRKEHFVLFNLCYNEELKLGEDYDLWIRCAKYMDIANIPEVLLNYRWHNNQTSIVHARKIADITTSTSLTLLADYGIHPDSNERLTHASVVSLQSPATEELLDKASNWLNDLCIRNTQSAIFSNAVFTKVAEESWFNVCNNSSELGIKAVHIYFRNQLSKNAHLNFLKIAKFLLKCLLKINTKVTHED